MDISPWQSHSHHLQYIIYMNNDVPHQTNINYYPFKIGIYHELCFMCPLNVEIVHRQGKWTWFQGPTMVSRHENPQEIRPVLKAVDGEGNDSTSIDARQRRMEFRMGFKEPSTKIPKSTISPWMKTEEIPSTIIRIYPQTPFREANIRNCQYSPRMIDKELIDTFASVYIYIFAEYCVLDNEHYRCLVVVSACVTYFFWCT